MIDVHTHLFNLKYLPLVGIINEYSNNKVPPLIANAISNALLRHTSNDGDEEIAGVDKKISLQKMDLLADPLFKLNQSEIVNRIVNNFSLSEISNIEMQEALLEFHRNISGNLDKTNALKSIYSFNIEKLENIKIDHFIFLTDSIKDMFNWVFSKIKKGENFVRWVYLMQHSETEIYNALQTNVPGMKYYVHHMMDVDNYFGNNSTYDFEKEQIPKMQKLTQKFKDKLICFVAYDPQKENCLDIIKDAIENKGFKGVKFYPPMGYKALGNSTLIDDRNKALFRYCIQKDLPLFTHCNNQGFEANRNEHSGYNSNPKYWEDLLLIEEFKNLRLCLAHAGGVQGWFCDVMVDEQIKAAGIDRIIFDSDDDQKNWNSSYAKLVYKLCVIYPNVYCDAAYLDEVLDSDVNKIKNFKERLLKLFSSEAIFVEKIMFGTDWHMLYQDGENDTFFSAYKNLFASPELLKYSSRFFEENALKFLKL